MRIVFRTAVMCVVLGGFAGPLNPVPNVSLCPKGDALHRDLVEGRWKSNDPVQRVFLVYTETSHRTGIILRTHGQYESIYTSVFKSGLLELVAVNGRLRAAGVVFRLSDPPKAGRYDETYFDTLTTVEWAAHDASLDRLIALRWLKRNAGRVVAQRMFGLHTLARSGH